MAVPKGPECTISGERELPKRPLVGVGIRKPSLTLRRFWRSVFSSMPKLERRPRGAARKLKEIRDALAPEPGGDGSAHRHQPPQLPRLGERARPHSGG